MEKQELYAFIKSQLDQGVTLSDVQKLLEKEHDHRMTYMDLRLISSELEVNWQVIDGVPEEPVEEEGSQVVDATVVGETQINVSKLTRPGAMMHGDVTFQSGGTADWHVDSMGRLGLNPTGGSAEPNEEDIADFQEKLQVMLQRSGM